MPHNVLAVANRFLRRGERKGIPLTPMHLQKLCYMAHGFGLAFLDERLIRDHVEAWAYGPVYPELYDALKRYGSGPVDELIRENNWAIIENIRGDVIEEAFLPDEREVINDVFDEYAAYPAFKLSALTHEDGSPWEKVYRDGGRSLVIPDELIRRYFSELAVTN